MKTPLDLLVPQEKKPDIDVIKNIVSDCVSNELEKFISTAEKIPSKEDIESVVKKTITTTLSNFEEKEEAEKAEETKTETETETE